MELMSSLSFVFRPVVVKRASCYAVSADRQAVPFGGLPRRYGAFDAFAEVREIALLAVFP
jgi:hypothetical protein